MYIDIVPNPNSPPAVLLREAWRDNGKVRKRTLANLSHLDPQVIEHLRTVLRGGHRRGLAFRAIAPRAFPSPRTRGCAARCRTPLWYGETARRRPGAAASAVLSLDRRARARARFQACHVAPTQGRHRHPHAVAALGARGGGTRDGL